MKDKGSYKRLNVAAIVVAYGWPSNNSGYGIAVSSSLRQYTQVYSQVHFIGLVDHSFEGSSRWAGKGIAWTHIPIVRHPRWMRFLKSMFKSLPAVTMQFASQSVRRQVAKIVAAYRQSGRKVVVIFEDIPPACLLPYIRREFPSIPVAIRSLNVTSKAFDRFCVEGLLISRLAWKLEVAKVQKFERDVLRMADRVWAVTETDLMGYCSRLGLCCDGIFGVSVDAERYASVVNGDIFTLIHVGSADLRKGKGLTRFINSSWKDIRSTVPQAEFLLGGRNTQQFTQAEVGIEGVGFLEDDRDILNRGLLFINPQESGAGIKLKSVVAMLAGKAIVSTKIGVEGIAGKSGEHFFVASDTKDLASLVIELMNDEELALRVGKNARELASAVYSEESLAQACEPLLRDFAMLVS
jgi:glycosyltransferase involved in cell wall biosynthesis